MLFIYLTSWQLAARQSAALPLKTNKQRWLKTEKTPFPARADSRINRTEQTEESCHSKQFSCVLK